MKNWPNVEFGTTLVIAGLSYSHKSSSCPGNNQKPKNTKFDMLGQFFVCWKRRKKVWCKPLLHAAIIGPQLKLTPNLLLGSLFFLTDTARILLFFALNRQKQKDGLYQQGYQPAFQKLDQDKMISTQSCMLAQFPVSSLHSVYQQLFPSFWKNWDSIEANFLVFSMPVLTPSSITAHYHFAFCQPVGVPDQCFADFKEVLPNARVVYT